MEQQHIVEASPQLALAPEKNDHYTLLLDLTQKVNRATGPERVFSIVADTLRQIFHIDRFAVTLVQPDGSLRAVTTRALSLEYLTGTQQRLAEGPGARSLAERMPFWVFDATTDPLFWPFHEEARKEGFRTVLILPLCTEAERLGYISMYHDHPRAYTPTEITLAQLLAQQTVFALQNARLLVATDMHRVELEQRFQRRVAESEAIDEIVLRVSSSLNLESTLQSITEAAASLSDAVSACIYLRDPDGTYRACAAHGVPLERLQQVPLSATVGLIAEMCGTQDVAQVLNYQDSAPQAPSLQVAAELDAHSTLGVPFVRDGEVVGALYVASAQIQQFPEDTIRVLRRLAAFAQVALHNAKRFSWVEAERSRLQRYVDAIPEGVMIFDRDGHVVLVNESLQREWKMRIPVLGLGREEIFSPQQQHSTRQIVFRFDPNAVVARVMASGEPEQGLLELRNPDRTYEMHFNALHAEDGGIQGIVVTTRDITLPLELGRERTRSHLLAELLNLSIVFNSELSTSNLMERVVEGAMTLVGARSGALGLLEGEHIVYRRFRLPHGWIDFDATLQQGEGGPGRVWETRNPYVSNDCEHDPYVLHQRQHEIGFHRLVIVPVMNRAGRFVGTLGVYDPVVERDFDRMDVEALQLLAHHVSIALENARFNQLKDEFLSIVSHELKTPITSIKGFTQVLQRRLPDEMLQQSGRYLEVINHQADRLTGLINDLLDLSRIQTGRFTFAVQPLDFTALLGEIVSEMHLLSTTDRITIAITDEPVAVMGNADRLRQVLVNLIDNALMHGPADGQVHITVSLDKDHVTTCVCDEGPGIPENEAERIFQPYYQVRNHSTLQARGLGLGLFITRRIVDEHHGRIWLDDVDHTRFCFTLPRA